MIDYLLQHIQHIGYWAYPALFIAMAFEGDLVLLTTGFFIRMGVLDPLWTTLALLGGTLFGDYGWYLVGRHSRHFRWKWLEKLYVATKFAEKHIIGKLAHTLCIAKFVYGLHRPICFRCGSLHVPRKIFIEANTAASIVWILVVAGIGYLAGASFMAARHYLKFAEIGIIVIILLIVGIMHFVSKKFKKDDLLK